MRSSFYAIKQQQRKPVMTRASFRPHRPVKMSAASSMAGLLSYFGLDEYSRLERKYTREIEDGSSDRDFEANLKDVLKMGILSMKNGDNDKAEKLFHIGLRMATDMQHQNGITYVLDLMANLALQAKDYPKAEQLFVSVMQRLIRLKGVSETDDAIVEMALKMASIHALMGQHEKAEMGYAFCVDTQRSKLMAEEAKDDTTALYGMCCDAFGQYLLERGRVKVARVHFEAGLEASARVYGEGSEQWLAMANGLATCYSMSGRTAEADALFEKIVILARELPSNRLAAYLVNSGLHHLHIAAVGTAGRLCQEALALVRRNGAGEEETDQEVRQQSVNCLRKVKEALK